MRSVCVPALRVAGLLMFLVGAAAAPAFAQYGRPAMDEPPLGEQYHIEGTFDFWSPGLDATISSESLGIIGSEINVKTDLGYVDKQVREFRLVLRPAKKHKFKLAYTPVDYTGDVILSRNLVFNGIKFNVGLPIQTEFQWNTWRFGYEYDFVYTDKFYVGFIAEVRQTDAQLQLQSPVDDEFTRARGPIPAIGGAFRVYPEKHVSITAEFTGFKLPQVQNYEVEEVALVVLHLRQLEPGEFRRDGHVLLGVHKIGRASCRERV